MVAILEVVYQKIKNGDSRILDQSAHAQTSRGDLRLDEDHRQDAQDAIHWPEESRLALHVGGRGVQPDTDEEYVL